VTWPLVVTDEGLNAPPLMLREPDEPTVVAPGSRVPELTDVEPLTARVVGVTVPPVTVTAPPESTVVTPITDVPELENVAIPPELLVKGRAPVRMPVPETFMVPSFTTPPVALIAPPEIASVPSFVMVDGDVFAVRVPALTVRLAPLSISTDPIVVFAVRFG
jgi:hypothetical protein